jgi:hypothetical protein
MASTLRRRVARLERAQAPPFVTLEDLVLMSYGHPLPVGKVYGGPLVELLEQRADRKEARDGAVR